MLKTLVVENLGSLNEGRAAGIINAALQEMIEDLDDRGHEDDKTRIVTIKVEAKKLPKSDTVALRLTAITSLPPRSTGAHMGIVKRNKEGGIDLLFQEFSENDPAQRTIDERLAEGPQQSADQ